MKHFHCLIFPRKEEEKEVKHDGGEEEMERGERERERGER